MTPVQETPQIFTLALMVCVLASLVTCLIAAYRLIRGRRSSAISLVTRWVICALVYLALSVGVSATRPAVVIEQGQNWCFDDWCIAVEKVRTTPSPNGRDVTYTADIRLYNGARSPEGTRGFWVYVRDENDRRYAPAPGAWKEVVAARVPPHGFARTSMDFVVPRGARGLALVTGHGGGTPCAPLPSLLEIGQAGCLFHKSNRIRIQ